MELDDQLAALAAGELDAADARALEARVAADPALAARLARFEQLQTVLRDWETPPLDAAATDRLDAAVTEALDQLEDAPLSEAATSAPPVLRALPDTDRDERAVAAASVPAAASDDPTDELAAARARRGVPTWVAGVGVAAALVAVVGIGVGVTGLGGGGIDFMASDDSAETMADSGVAESDMADDGAMEESADEAAPEAMLDAPMEDGATGAAGDTAAGEAATAEMAPRRETGVTIEQGDLLTLAVLRTTDAPSDDAAEDADGFATCTDEALMRDSDPDDERVIDLLASGTYAGEDAVFVVLRTPSADGDVVTVYAYDPTDCSLIDQATDAG